MATYIAATVGITEWRTKFRQGMNRRDNETNGRAIDSLLNYEQVKTNVKEKYEVDSYETKIIDYQKAQLELNYSLAALNMSQSIIMITGSAVGTFMCLKNVLDGHFTVGDYIMFGTYIG